jgi:hypothetical protein
MAALPEDFLKKVIEEVAALKGIKDAQQNVKVNDPTVAACARVAYSQVCEECRQPFHYGERTQVFDDYFGPLLLRSMPVDRTKPIQVFVDGVEVAPADWRIVKNRLILYDQVDTDTGETLYKNIEFTSTCGIPILETIPRLFTATQLQAIGNLHRKDSYGLSEVAWEKGVARKPADAGQLLESARQLLGDLIYNGHGYSLDGE